MINKFYFVPAVALVFVAGPLSLAHAQGCLIGANYVDSHPGKPFTAESRTIDSTGNSQRVSPFLELIARDRDGRIRQTHSLSYMPSPQGQHMTTLTLSDGTTRAVTSDELAESIMIFDCSAGATIQLQPGMRIARTIQRQPPASQSFNRQYSSIFFAVPQAKSNPGAQFEDLGFREFQGIVAHGGRITRLGTKADGDWSGKPIHSDEQWVSDDLAVSLLIVRKDFQKGDESRIELINIKLGDPDPSLFKIPEGYTINPAMDQMPKVFLSNQPKVSSPQ